MLRGMAFSRRKGIRREFEKNPKEKKHGSANHSNDRNAKTTTFPHGAAFSSIKEKNKGKKQENGRRNRAPALPPRRYRSVHTHTHTYIHPSSQNEFLYGYIDIDAVHSFFFKPGETETEPERGYIHGMESTI